MRANDNVNLKVKPGEIHALLGENGAGKSTLVKMIYGILAPDEGQILFDGAPSRISNPRAARRLGIGMVFQHFSLFEAMTVLENIALGLDAASRSASSSPSSTGCSTPISSSSIRAGSSRRSASASGSASRSCARCSSIRVS